MTNTILLPAISILLLLLLAQPCHGNSKYCGTYRSYPYVGLRCLSPTSPSMGILWYRPSSNLPLRSTLRHEANHDDHLARFGWNQHDGSSYGRQEIVDPENHIQLTVQWVYLKVGRWVLRVSGDAFGDIGNGNSSESSLLWYVSTPGNLTATYDPKNGVIEGDDFASCVVPSIDNASPSYSDGTVEKNYNATYFAAFQVSPDQHFNPKPNILQELRNPTSSLPPHLFDIEALYRAETVMTGNQIVQQLFLKAPFEVDFHFTVYESSRTYRRPSSCGSSWEEVTSALHEAQARLQQRFAETFVHTINPTKAPQNLSDHQIVSKHIWAASWTDEQIKTAQYALGSMMSSISYMHGKSQIYDTQTKEVSMGPLTKGLTIVPDRPDHAQGYLWDDGFHQHLVRHWDMNWTMDILRSWYGKVDNDGWIPRQMIIGEEARWSARPTSWPQIAGSANPPSHHLILLSLLETTYVDNTQHQVDLDGFFGDIWKPLKRNFGWYLTTQASTLPGFFRWRGRTKDYCLPSGMDDYPRAPILTDNEAHLDLQCWMVSSSRAVATVASFLEDSEAAVHYADMSETFTNSVLANFWNEEEGLFDDFYNTEDGKKTFVGHFGYLNFFPLFLDVLPTNSTLFE